MLQVAGKVRSCRLVVELEACCAHGLRCVALRRVARASRSVLETRRPAHGLRRNFEGRGGRRARGGSGGGMGAGEGGGEAEGEGGEAKKYKLEDDESVADGEVADADADLLPAPFVPNEVEEVQRHHI